MSGVAARGTDWEDSLAPVRPVDVETVVDRLAGARRLVVLDDDPTGTQTIRDVPVLTQWGADDIRWALDAGGAGFFVLTNTRSLSEKDAAARNREVATRCLEVALERGIDIVFASRGDSTLRGHFPLETDVLSEVSAAHGGPIDGIVLSPAYLDAGRVTLDGIHWVRSAAGLQPVAEGEYARDATFGYRSSRLPEWVEEKSGGRIPATSVVVADLDGIRRSEGGLTATLEHSRNGEIVVVDAIADDDLRSVTLSVLAAEAAGARLLYRVGPSFVRARLGQGTQPPLTDAELAEIVDGGARHGLVVVGSHVGVTTRQLSRLTEGRDLALIELEVARVIDGSIDIPALVARAVSELGSRLVVITTSRELRTGDSAESSLEISRRVSAALTSTVRQVVAASRPRFVVAKGGITSSDIATSALDIDRATVRGSLLPGIVSLWQAASGPSAGLGYVVFAGNVGDDDSLAVVVDRLEEQ